MQIRLGGKQIPLTAHRREDYFLCEKVQLDKMAQPQGVQLTGVGCRLWQIWVSNLQRSRYDRVVVKERQAESADRQRVRDR